MNAEQRAAGKRTVVTSSGYVLEIGPDSKPIIPKVGESVHRLASVVGDCFGGVACGGVIAAYKGLRWLGMELEDKFVKLGQANIQKHRRTWEALGDPVPVLLQGDSRRFHEIVSVAAIDWEEVLVVRKP